MNKVFFVQNGQIFFQPKGHKKSVVLTDEVLEATRAFLLSKIDTPECCGATINFSDSELSLTMKTPRYSANLGKKENETFKPF